MYVVTSLFFAENVHIFVFCLFHFGSIKPVYSAMYPPGEIPSHAHVSSSRSPGKQKTKKGDSFAKFDSNTSDVWDVDENEDFSFLTPQKHSTGYNQRYATNSSQLETSSEAERVSPSVVTGNEGSKSSTPSSQPSQKKKTGMS